jgi:hypothetical protein
MSADLAPPPPGPWEASPYSGYGTRYWTVQRLNKAWLGGIQTMMTATFNPRRFGSEAAAKKAADAANAKESQA